MSSSYGWIFHRKLLRARNRPSFFYEDMLDIQQYLVDGFNLPLRKMMEWTSVGMIFPFPNCFWKYKKSSHVPVTNQIMFHGFPKNGIQKPIWPWGWWLLGWGVPGTQCLVCLPGRGIPNVLAKLKHVKKTPCGWLNLKFRRKIPMFIYVCWSNPHVRFV